MQYPEEPPSFLVDISAMYPPASRLCAGPALTEKEQIPLPKELADFVFPIFYLGLLIQSF